MIDSRAVIDQTAHIAPTVTISPYAIIGADVSIGEGTWIGPHVIIKGHTRIGKHNKIYQFASIGEDPQDKKYQGEPTLLEIGDNNVMRECCTINRGTIQGGGKTVIGHDNLFMAYTHIAHDCQIGSHIVFANSSALAGHVTVQDYAILSGFSMVHQYCTIGAYSFVSGATGISKDVLPYLLVSGNGGHDAHAYGLNTVGLRRCGFSETAISGLKKAYSIIFRQHLTVNVAMAKLKVLQTDHPEIKAMLTGLENTKRGIVR